MYVEAAEAAGEPAAEFVNAKAGRFAALREIEDDGTFVLARAHPLRFAVERSDSTGADLGLARGSRTLIEGLRGSADGGYI